MPNYFAPLAEEFKATPGQPNGQQRAARRKRRRTNRKTELTELTTPALFPSADTVTVDASPEEEKKSDFDDSSDAATPVRALTFASHSSSSNDSSRDDARAVALLVRLNYNDLSANQKEVLATFATFLRDENPKLAEKMLSVTDPKALEKLDDASRRACTNFFIKHEATLKIILGFGITSFPMFMQYLFPPFVSVKDIELAWAFAIVGVSVNTGLTALVAGPVFADAVISTLSFFKECWDSGTSATFRKLGESLYPDEWIPAAAADIAAQAEDQSWGAWTTGFAQRLRLSLPLVRWASQAAVIAATIFLTDALANGSIDAANTARSVDGIEAGETPENSQAIKWYILIVNLVLYSKDAVIAAGNALKLPSSADRVKGDLIAGEIDKVLFVRDAREKRQLSETLNGWMADVSRSLLKRSENFTGRLKGLEIAADTTAEDFQTAFKALLTAVIKNDKEIGRRESAAKICLPAEVLAELTKQHLNSLPISVAKKRELLDSAEQVLDAHQAFLKRRAKAHLEQELSVLQEIIEKFPTLLAVLHPVSKVSRFAGRVVGAWSSIVFLLSMVQFISKEDALPDTPFGLTLSATGAAIVGYFSTVCFDETVANAIDKIIRIKRDGGLCSSKAHGDILNLILGLAMGGFSSATAAFQSGGGSSTPAQPSEDIFSTALRSVTFGTSALATFASAGNAAVVNALGAQNLLEKVGMSSSWLLQWCGCLTSRGSAVRGLFEGETEPVARTPMLYGAMATVTTPLLAATRGRTGDGGRSSLNP